MLGLLAFCLCANQGAIAQAQAESGSHDVMRIENEFKLAVPSNLEDSVWQYLLARYDNNNFFLKELDPSFNTQFAEEFFVDQYFDDKAFRVMASMNGVRCRSRVVLSDPYSEKDGRDLIQLKFNEIGSDNNLNRGEYKYPVDDEALQLSNNNPQPLLRLAETAYRKEVIRRLKQHGIDAFSLYPTIRLEQMRRRAYVSKGAVPFATLTLDNVTALYEGQSRQFVELELELNEIGYTQSDSAGRAEMERINGLVKTDILNRFPAIKQDQTPKYNKAGLAFGIKAESIPAEEQGNAFSPYFWVAAISGLLLTLGLLWRKWNSQKPGTAR